MGINCGVDIVEVERIKKALENERFLQRVYTVDEAEYCDAKKAGKYESFAARFAAKEAALKAFGTGIGGRGINIVDIEVRNGALGKPEILLHGEAMTEFERMMAKSISLSMSHCKKYAVATVIIET
jgi:holo-[acyl-carrier protein] synthase